MEIHLQDQPGSARKSPSTGISVAACVLFDHTRRGEIESPDLGKVCSSYSVCSPEFLGNAPEATRRRKFPAMRKYLLPSFVLVAYHERGQPVDGVLVMSPGTTD